MKKLATIVATLIGLSLAQNAGADIVFYKDGRVKSEVVATEIGLNEKGKKTKYQLCHLAGIDRQGDSLTVWHKLINENVSEDVDDSALSIMVKDKNGVEELIEGKNIERYLFTNNVVPDESIIKKYALRDKVNEYLKSKGMRPGSTFSIYTDAIIEQYGLVAIDSLSLANTYNYSNVIFKLLPSKEAAERERSTLEKGLDTYVTKVAGKSGGEMIPFNVKGSTALFLLDLIHEYWHDNCKDKAIPLNIEDSVCDALSYALAEDFCEKTFGKESAEVKEVREEVERNIKFKRVINECYEKISRLYNSSLSKTEKLNKKKEILEEYNKKAGMELNNASLSVWSSYTKHFELIDSAVKNSGSLENAIKAMQGIPDTSEEDAINYLKKLIKK